MADGEVLDQRRWADRPRWQRWSLYGLLSIGGFALLGGGRGSPPTPEETAAAAEATALNDTTEVARWHSEVEQLSTRCDVATAGLVAVFQAAAEGEGSPLAGYQMANTVDEACGAAWLGVDDIAPPAAAESVESAAEHATETCKAAYFSRKELGEAAAIVFDGDFRPSAQVRLRDELVLAGRQSEACRSAIAAVTG